MTDHPAHEPATTAAIELRNELLAKGWPDDHHLAGLVAKTPGLDAATYATHARTNGTLLGVWSEPRRAFIYPDFQFDRSGTVRKEVTELLAVLPANKDDRGGWRRAFWLYSPHSLLDGQTPVDVFADAPMRVIKVAREEFMGDPGASW
ncbi:hypothetical protein NDK50_22500 [Paraburkholderia bryophila]|uniref:hypothetical protein n=1 Tax=Paraburkholderia bryophila TaxID=420952 RepID=UPI002349D253|nr:hypothetical protein [Paraburkholderia bryophila]WCM23633.1 hypothetical protein NDK50_22500 [Paraburkholderia bryophila]